jgi:hypothetical protein
MVRVKVAAQIRVKVVPQIRVTVVPQIRVKVVPRVKVVVLVRVKVVAVKKDRRPPRERRRGLSDAWVPPDSLRAGAASV